MNIKLLLISFILLFTFQTKAQKKFIDYKPKYKEWSSRYILDKVEYTKENTIFHFRYLARKNATSFMTFHGVGHEYAWTLQNIDNPEEVFEMLALKNIRRNGILIIPDFKEIARNFNLKPKYVFTCEVHFPKLPKHIKKVHFLEGINSIEAWGHFNCLNVKIKHKDEDLGTEKDLEKRVKELENRVWGEYIEEVIEIIEVVEVEKPKKVIEECQAEIVE